MRALTAIGEVGIETGGRSYLLRPSLFSMSQIGTPADIVETTAILLSPEPDNAYVLRRFRKERFERALTVLYACAGDHNLGDLIGGMVPTGRGRIAYSPGSMPMHDIVAIAQGLIRHGILGDVEASAENGEPMKEFKAVDYVSASIAHLGLSETEAWNLTMTSFVQIMRSKFPPKPGQQTKPMTADDVEAKLARLEKINAARAGKK